MKLKFVCSLTAMVTLVAAAALAQTNKTASAPLPAAPGAASDPAPTTAAGGGGSKIGTINIQNAILYSNEGQRDFEAMRKKLEPKQNELKSQSDQIEELKKQLNTQGNTLNDDAKSNLQRQIEQKQKTLERGQQDFQEEVSGQENEIAQRILQKMAPIVVKYANEHGFRMILDTSNPWPQGPVLWAKTDDVDVDITKPVVDAYNAQSGVAPPATRSTPPVGGTKPGGTGATRPAGTGATRPAGTNRPATSPSTTTPPPK